VNLAISAVATVREPDTPSALRSRIVGNLIAEVEKRVHVRRTQAIVALHREDDGDVSILAPDHDRFALGRVEDRSRSVLGLCCRVLFLMNSLISDSF
jgi:hypothetical protein